MNEMEVVGATIRR